MSAIPATPLLDTVDTPDDLRKLQPSQLRQLADELRAEMISAVGETGGHLGSGLGVVELTVAIHYVFDTPVDRLVWDVGHQAYPHKILTGRRSRIRTLRQGGGLSGFTKRSESEYDPFGTAHSSTSISAALGFAVANKLENRPGKGIAVIGDGAMSAGMAYEAMNNAEAAGNRLIVILNDNDMSIAPPVGGLSAYLARLVSSGPFLGLRDTLRKISRRLPEPLHKAAKKTDEFARGLAMGGTLFEELGFYYVGPIDGHNLDQLIPVLENVRDAAEGPCLIHVVTQKGKGYAPAEASADRYHGDPTDLENGAASVLLALDPAERAARIENDLRQIAFARDGMRWGASVFWNQIEDAIVNVTLGAGPATFPRAGFVPAGGVLRQRQNAGTIDAWGVELTGALDLSSAVSLNAAASWTDAEIDGGSSAAQLTGLRPAQAPEWSATAGLDWRATDRVTLALAARYESSRFDDDLNSRVLDAAVTLDGRAEWAFRPNATLWMAADNLFDEDVVTRNAGGSIDLGTPRTLWIGVTVRG